MANSGCCHFTSRHPNQTQSKPILSYPILSYPILSYPVQSIQSNPIQSKTIQSNPNQSHRLLQRLVSRGADCVIFGCTEVGMLLDEKNVSVPVFDSTSIHCEQALDFALTDVKTPSRQGFWAPGEKRGS